MDLLKAKTQSILGQITNPGTFFESRELSFGTSFVGLIEILMEKSALKGLTQVLNSLLYIKFVCKLSYEDEVSPTQYSVVAPGPAVQATALDSDHHTLRRLEAGS